MNTANGQVLRRAAQIVRLNDLKLAAIGLGVPRGQPILGRVAGMGLPVFLPALVLVAILTLMGAPPWSVSVMFACGGCIWIARAVRAAPEEHRCQT